LTLFSANAVHAVVDGGGGDNVSTVGSDGGDEWRFTVGAGPALVPDYEGSDDYEVAPLPIFRADKGPVNVSLFGNKLTANLIPHDNWRFGPLVQFRRERDNDVDNKRVGDMKDVDAALELGAQLGYDFILPGGTLGIEVEGAHDVNDEYNGWWVSPKIGFKTKFEEKWSFAMNGGMTFADDGFMKHYFGVGPKNRGNSQFPDYDADGGEKDFFFSAGLGYQCTKNWGVGVVGQWKQLIGDADNDSPVVGVGSKQQYVAAAYVTYTFN
jgi:outer membrane scaffolding protein for murein synthesis (MipA/OmpV family)